MRFEMAMGYIVTANSDGTIPLNAKIAAKLDGAEFATSTLVHQANCYQDLLAALELLYAETADYITINRLGALDNQSMIQARAAIAKAKL